MPLVSDQAICIRHWDWSETSQTVSLFSREHGLIRGVAKGAKREKSTFSGGIELMTRGEVVASLKNTDTLSTLTAWNLLETFSSSRSTLHGFYGGMAMLDIVQHSMGVADPHPDFYDSLVVGLRELAIPAMQRQAVLGVVWNALLHTGHAPELRLDIRTGEPLAPAAVYGFWPGLGGFSVLTASPSLDAEPAMQTVWKVRRETFTYALKLASPEGVETEAFDEAAHEAVDEQTSKRCLQLMLAYFRWVFATEAQAFSQFVTMACV